MHTHRRQTLLLVGGLLITAQAWTVLDAAVKGLIVLSHGTGGSELAHSSLAEALAQHGYLVAPVVSMAPVGVVFDAQSLAEIRVPRALYEAERDSWLVPRFHARWVGGHVTGAELHRLPNAWHFAFTDTPSIAIAT